MSEPYLKHEGVHSAVNDQFISSVPHKSETRWRPNVLSMRGGGGDEMECSVWLSALVFVEMHLLHLFLQEGDGHGATSGSRWQRVDLGDKFIVKTTFKVGFFLLPSH